MQAGNNKNQRLLQLFLSLSATIAKVLCLLFVYLVHSLEFLYQLMSKLVQIHIYTCIQMYMYYVLQVDIRLLYNIVFIKQFVNLFFFKMKNFFFKDVKLFFQDDPINWDEPILFQVPKLGDRYFEWVHRPIDGHLRLMKSEICEFFSQCPWYMVPIVWIPVVMLLLYTSYTSLKDEPCSFAVTFSEGTAFFLFTVQFSGELDHQAFSFNVLLVRYLLAAREGGIWIIKSSVFTICLFLRRYIPAMQG